ncbi:hydrolase [Paraferrimonas sedimenticola]|uniref:Hydrolase n=1 Tax=Paraferrimonas sedimenticola TaxID=375674 RepID=A0AA37RYP5_9GAMM|nr:hydrolase [Paraferrimonas sedimenticola]GLP97905.1 hydrolase [Paraferrimonas sedimenticola]
MLNKDKTALVLIDVQGKLARLVDRSDAMIAGCQKLIQGAQALGLPILWLEQNPEKLGGTVEELTGLLSGEEPIIKYAFSASGENAFNQRLSALDVESVLVCGIETHICVCQSSLDLKAQGYDVHVVSDAVASRTETNKQLAFERLRQNGITISGVEMCLYEMVEDCRAPEFKPILNLIK